MAVVLVGNIVLVGFIEGIFVVDDVFANVGIFSVGVVTCMSDDCDIVSSRYNSFVVFVAVGGVAIVGVAILIIISYHRLRI